jgi:hypothetical protein
MNIEKLNISISKGNIEWRKHVFERMLERNISRHEIIDVLLHGELIEDYIEDKPFGSALFYKLVQNRPIHVVAALDDKTDRTYIITVYEPTLDVFEKDYRTRKIK